MDGKGADGFPGLVKTCDGFNGVSLKRAFNARTLAKLFCSRQCLYLQKEIKGEHFTSGARLHPNTANLLLLLSFFASLANANANSK